MKKALIIAIAVVAATSAFAQKKADKKATPTTINCAVMSANKVNIADATKNHMYADYKGKRYFFCCGGCPSSFKKDPAKYAKSAPSIPTPKQSKSKK